MKLFEQGKLRINDPVTESYLPEFQGGVSDITIRLLMTHFSGMPPDLELIPRWTGYQTGIDRALVTKPIAPPGAKFIYSDINFILLGEIVHRLLWANASGVRAATDLAPLGMNDTPLSARNRLLLRIAPTEIDKDTGVPLRGLVHDPTSRYMGGVAGHAGVFTTGDDLGKYAAMMLGLGDLNGVRIFQPMTVQASPNPPVPPISPFCARSVGTWTRRFQVIAANCTRSVRSVIPATLARRFGWTRRQTLS